jgi:cytochrome b subunit of formate dehydrogenase
MKARLQRFVSVILALGLAGSGAAVGAPPAAADPSSRPAGVCPPFHLRDGQGAKIDPVAGVNATVPYSPRQTCGATGCHDYEKITRGYHFTQGQGEAPTADQRARYAWATSPGNFGGNWCSPAPLYRYLSPKDNPSPARMDMTAFDFFTSSCGTCHPGGGSAELDRSGKRYDRWMADPASGLQPGAENRFDGDYYKARWSETGVLEADCLLCHLPTYDSAERQAQLGKWNLRWAATAGARLAAVTGSVKDGKPVEVTYDTGRFDTDGTLKLSLVRQPRNEACLGCHAQPAWKKRGANYRGRTDVHLRAGLKCVDCHPAGRFARDPRISSREEHQFAKGDDPGGLVRNDLDDTVVGCAECHDTGRHGAPAAKHPGLPALHLDRIACQTCHIPERLVMPAQVQAGDVFNPAPWVKPASKRLWTFYGPDGLARNHYGFLEVMGYDDKPTEPFRPKLFRYKEKIYPGNRIHSSWPGLEVEGQEALAQPRMGDIVKMWTAHRQDPTKYPRLAAIVDDTGDGVPEVNRPEEIEALLASVRQALEDVGYPLEKTRVVWVKNERVYRSGTEYREVPKHDWEASPFANTHKYSHDVYPARAALGANGCRDCHSSDSPFFFQAALADPFGPDGKPVWTAQSPVLGYDGSSPRYTGLAGGVAAFFRWLAIVVMLLLVGHIALDATARFRHRKLANPRSASSDEWVQRFNDQFRAQHLLLMVSVTALCLSGVFLFGTRFPGASWAAALTGALGGLDVWRLVHRLGGLLLVATAAWHLVYSLIHEEGRRDFRLLLPTPADFRHLWQNLRHFFGRTDRPPEFGRFAYFEKFDYWAVFWGCAIMIGTGLALWFGDGLLRLWPGLRQSSLDTFKEAHAHEAVLALLAIAIWHVYNIHVRAGRFPGSWLWVHGRMSREEMEREHPADPSLAK